MSTPSSVSKSLKPTNAASIVPPIPGENAKSLLYSREVNGVIVARCGWGRNQVLPFVDSSNHRLSLPCLGAEEMSVDVPRQAIQILCTCREDSRSLFARMATSRSVVLHGQHELLHETIHACSESPYIPRRSGGPPDETVRDVLDDPCSCLDLPPDGQTVRGVASLMQVADFGDEWATNIEWLE